MRTVAIIVGISLMSLASAKATHNHSDKITNSKPSQLFKTLHLELKDEDFRLPSSVVCFPEPSKPWFRWNTKKTPYSPINSIDTHMFGPNFAKVYKLLVEKKGTAQEHKNFDFISEFIGLKITLSKRFNDPCEFTNVCTDKHIPYEWIDDLYRELWNQVRTDTPFFRPYERAPLRDRAPSSSEEHPLLDPPSAAGKAISPDLDSTSDDDSEQEMVAASSVKQRPSKTSPASNREPK